MLPKNKSRKEKSNGNQYGARARSRQSIALHGHEADILSDRVQEKERIGIVPEGVFPAYCSSYFPDENIIDFENLPLKHRDELASKCTWQPLKEIALCSEGS